MPKLKIIIFLFILLFGAWFIYTNYFNSANKPEYNLCLEKGYEFYIKSFMTKDGRIIDPDRDNVTTSEGQSYMLVRSLVMKDKRTFDLVYTWTRNNLQRKDKLFSWLWGEDKNGEYKILDDNSATDADVDIACALLLAYESWGDHKYLNEAVPIIHSIWDNETKRVGTHLVLMPGVEQTYSKKIEVNPSYFSPYAFRFFQKYDDIHDWSCLIDSGYYYLSKITSMTETGLPPNWFLIVNSQEDGSNEGQIILEDSPRSDFSYDSIRVFLRTYLDYIETGEPRALPILKKSKFFVDRWKITKNFYIDYEKNGKLRDKEKFIGSIAVLIPVISLYDKTSAFEIYKSEVEPHFLNEEYWSNKKSYYGKNLSWFGCYLYNRESQEYKEMHRRKFANEFKQ